MRLKITFQGLKQYEKDFLVKDFNYFRGQERFDTCRTLEKIKTNRGLASKFVNLARRTSFGSVTVESFVNRLEMMKDFEIFDFQVWFEEEETVVILKANEIYFALVDMVHSGIKRKNFINKVEKNLKKTYTKHIKIEELPDEEERPD